MKSRPTPKLNNTQNYTTARLELGNDNRTTTTSDSNLESENNPGNSRQAENELGKYEQKLAKPKQEKGGVYGEILNENKG